MPTYRIQLEYDGAGFHGWQVQPALRTVQGEIERALSLITRETVRSAGAGRTDRGVHARGQVVSFGLDRPFEPRRLAAGIEGICGDDLNVRRLEIAPERFHARHDARWRTYRYRILARPSSLWRSRAWHPRSLAPLPALRRASDPLVGCHDFTSFANASPENGPARCTIEHLCWDCWEEGYLLTIRADRFLYRMVRNLVGTLMEVASREGVRGGRVIEEILEERSRRAAAAPAPAGGLCLEAVGYDPPWPEPGAT